MSQTSPLTSALKSELWKRFGTPEYPAEWDGRVHGGGKISQRFWEYFKTIELLELDKDSVVLDIGGGSPETGLGFFAAILSTQVKKLIVMDPCVENAKPISGKVELIAKNANYEELKSVLHSHPEITHICSVSVFEHIEPVVRQEITKAINDFFSGLSFVTTFEFHGEHEFFAHQLTTRTGSQLFGALTRFYLDRYEASPVGCENSFDRDEIFRLRDRRFFWQRPRFSPSYVPRWYPLALRFLRN